MIELKTLFDDPCQVDEFPDELAAVATGAKAMSVFTFSRTFVDHDGYDSAYVELVEAAFNSGLLVVNHPFDAHHIYVFVLKHGELWRVQAYIALKAAYRFPGCRWSDGAEVLESNLLGYSHDSIVAWMSSLRNRRVAWGLPTIYLLVTVSQRKQITELAMGRFVPPRIAPGIRVFEVRGRRTLKHSIADTHPDMSVGRVAVKHPIVPRLFGRLQDIADEEIVSTTLTEEVAIEFNLALESKIEFWGQDGWR